MVSAALTVTVTGEAVPSVALGVVPLVVELINAPAVALVMVTCVPAGTAPATGLNVGVATAGASV
jgi:hypothetical protein